MWISPIFMIIALEQNEDEHTELSDYISNTYEKLMENLNGGWGRGQIWRHPTRQRKPLLLFLFSRVSCVLQKKMKSLFFRLWYEHKDLKWWHSFLCQGVSNLYISWYPRDTCYFFSLKIAIPMQSLVQNFGWGIYQILDRNCLFCRRFWCYHDCLSIAVSQITIFYKNTGFCQVNHG